MQTANQPSNRTLLYLLVGVLITCLVWWVGPRLYVPVHKMLPPELTQSASVSNEEARRQIGKLEAQISQLQSENRQLQTAGNDQARISSTTLPSRFLSARVLVRPPQTAYDVLLINSGEDQGVTAGSVVWWPPGVYLGEVVQVHENSSLVRLVSSPNVRHAGRIENRITATTRGRGGGAMRATIPADNGIATGTLVVSDRWGAPYARIVNREPAAALAEERLFLQPIIPSSVIENVYVER